MCTSKSLMPREKSPARFTAYHKAPWPIQQTATVGAPQRASIKSITRPSAMRGEARPRGRSQSAGAPGRNVKISSVTDLCFSLFVRPLSINLPEILLRALLCQSVKPCCRDHSLSCSETKTSSTFYEQVKKYNLLLLFSILFHFACSRSGCTLKS